MLLKTWVFKNTFYEPLKGLPMKIIFLIAVASVLFLGGCRARRMTIPEAPAPAPRGTIADTPAQPQENLQEIPTRSERFTFVRPSDQAVHEANRFFVILGSFSVQENAVRFVETLRARGFEPVILMSETGMNRVSIDSFNDETVARIRVNRIRANFPEYADAWLLIRTR